MISEEKRFKLIQLISGKILTDRFPDNFYSLSMEEQDDFIYNNLTDAFEYCSSDTVCSMIEDIADLSISFIGE